MSKTFLDALSYFRKNNDKPSIEFVKYVLKKYFDERKVFMQLDEAIPYLDHDDREHLFSIMEGAWEI
tara:strand:+ start:2919 stop:3119 length:201 start_codon:yes stop_codon:yes gene_type:complete